MKDSLQENLKIIKNENENLTKQIKEQKKGIFSVWQNSLMFVLIGVICTVFAYGALNFLSLKTDFIQEISKTGAENSIKKQAVKEYQKTMLEDNEHKELDNLIKKYNEKRK